MGRGQRRRSPSLDLDILRGCHVRLHTDGGGVDGGRIEGDERVSDAWGDGGCERIQDKGCENGGEMDGKWM